MPWINWRVASRSPYQKAVENSISSYARFDLYWLGQDAKDLGRQKLF
jgi:hypothetical protein